MKEDMLRVGVVSSTHGIKGEVKVFPTTDDSTRFKELKKVYIEFKERNKQGKIIIKNICLKIDSVKFFKQFVILKFNGIDDINEVEKYKGYDLYIDREDAVELKDGEFFISDLIGIEVIDDENNHIGILKDVLQTGANDVYIVKMDDGKEVLLPAIKECIKETSLEDGKMTVHIMEGLMDL